MPRKRAMGVASSTEKSAGGKGGSRSLTQAGTASPIVHPKPSSRASSEGGEERLYKAASEPVGTAMVLKENVPPAYNTRGAKRVRGDTPVSPSSVRRSKRHEARHAATSPTGDNGPLLQDPPSIRTNPVPSKPSTPSPSKAAARVSRRLRNTITEDTDIEDSDSSILSTLSNMSNFSASLATGVSHRSSTRTTYSAPHGDESPEAQNSHAVITNIKCAFADIPIGEIAYGRLLTMDPSPEITIKGVGPIKLPLTNDQLVAIRNKGHEPFEGKFGSDWPFNSAQRLTSIIYEDDFQIERHFEYLDGDTWGTYITPLLRDVATYLGYGSEVPIEAKQRSLCLWEKGSLWRNYTKPHPKEVQNWIGTVLLILDHECEGGEIAARYKNKDILFEHAAKGRFLIASHAGTHLDVMPLTKGYSFGVTFELYLDEDPTKGKFLDMLVESNKTSEAQLAWDLSEWILQVNRGDMSNFPVLHVLDGSYGPHDMTIYQVNATDRALVLAVLKAINNKHVSPRSGRALRAYFVIVKATSKNYSTSYRMRYSVDWAATLDGHPRPDVKSVIIEAPGVLQKSKFLNGTIMRQVTDTMSTTTAMVQCLMLVWEDVN